MHRGFQLYLDDILWKIIMRVYLACRICLKRFLSTICSLTIGGGGGGGHSAKMYLKGTLSASGHYPRGDSNAMIPAVLI